MAGQRSQAGETRPLKEGVASRLDGDRRKQVRAGDTTAATVQLDSLLARAVLRRARPAASCRVSAVFLVFPGEEPDAENHTNLSHPNAPSRGQSIHRHAIAAFLLRRFTPARSLHVDPGVLSVRGCDRGVCRSR